MSRILEVSPEGPNARVKPVGAFKPDEHSARAEKALGRA